MNTEEEPIKKRFTCPNCGNNVSAPPEDVLEPVDCPHCGQAGMFTLAKPKPGEPEESSRSKATDDSKESKKLDQIDSAADALAASEFSDDKPLREEKNPAAHERKAPPRRKKSVTPPRRGGDLSPPRRDRPGYRRHDPRPAPPPTKEGVSLLTVFLAIVAVVMSVVIIMIMIPRNLNFIQGYPAKSIGSGRATPRNLLAEFQKILGPKDRSISFTEAEVNAYLNHRVQGKQRGAMKGLVKFKGAYVDLEPNRSELFIERTVIGIPFTMSLKLSKAKFEHKTTWKAGGGSIGSFKMSSRQFKPILDAFVRLGVACEEEMDAIQRMGDVRFENDKVTLDPGFGGNTPEKPAPEPAPAKPEPEPAPAGEPAMEGEMTPAMESETMEGEAMEGGDTPAPDPAKEPDPDGDQ